MFSDGGAEMQILRRLGARTGQNGTTISLATYYKETRASYNQYIPTALPLIHGPQQTEERKINGYLPIPNRIH